MRATLMAAMALAVWAAGALGARRGPADETPRATDLLRAEQMAEEVEGRRRLPPPAHRGGWKRGGTGFGASDAPAAGGGRDARDVIINVRPPSRGSHAAP